jgi:LytS/YehU family sensor histidine kinase
MKKIAGFEEQTDLSKTWLFVVLAFGIAAFLVRWAGLTVPVLGTTVKLGSREIFITLGAAITGPVGGSIIGFFAGLSTLSTPTGQSDLISHVIGGLLIGFLYKPVYRRWRLPGLLLGWAFLIAIYYCIAIIPVYLMGVSLITPGGLSGVFGPDVSFFQAYRLIIQAGILEVAVTTIITMIILAALPDKFRRPLW